MKKIIILLLSILFINFSTTRAQSFASYKTVANESTEVNDYVAYGWAPFYGIASYYARSLHGRPTASGELYDRAKFTAACNILPLGTIVKVTNLKNNRSVNVRINDRLSKKVGRLIDLSRRAADYLRYTSQGLTRVKLQVID